MDSEWSEWKNLKKLSERVGRRTFVGVPEKPGIYVIRWLKNGKPAIINRFKGKDKRGILYIGSSTNLKTRIKTFWKAATKDKPGKEKESHSGGEHFFLLPLQ